MSDIFDPYNYLVESTEPYLEEGVVYEAGLSRVWQHTSAPFAILTAFRNNFTLKQNRNRNRDLEKQLKSIRAGGIKLTGHWEEAPDGMNWKEAKAQGRVEDIVEESYFIPMPGNLEYDEFEKFVHGLLKKYNQDAGVIGDGTQAYLMWKDGSKDELGKAHFSKMGQAYSTIRGKKVPFIFEGTIQPSNNMHRIGMQKRGLVWFSETNTLDENVKTWSDAQWLINELEQSFKKYFGKSYFAATLGTKGMFRGTISVHFSLGQKGEYDMNIFENDPMPHKILIDGFDENGDLVKPKATADTALGGALFIKPPEGSYYAFETVKFGWRKISGDVNTIARRMDKYFEKVYNTVRENVDNIPPQKSYDVRKKI